MVEIAGLGYSGTTNVYKKALQKCKLNEEQDDLDHLCIAVLGDFADSKVGDGYRVRVKDYNFMYDNILYIVSAHIKHKINVYIHIIFCINSTQHV